MNPADPHVIHDACHRAYARAAHDERAHWARRCDALAAETPSDSQKAAYERLARELRGVEG